MASDSDSETNGGETIGEMASTVTTSMDGLTDLMTSGAYLAGEAYEVAGVLAFKATDDHDNPNQLP